MAQVADHSAIVIQLLSPSLIKRVLPALKRIMIFCQIAKHVNLQSSAVPVQYQSLLDLTVDLNN